MNRFAEISIRSPGVGVAVMIATMCAQSAALGQCQLANPSFERLGDSGTVFGGWFDVNGVAWDTALAAHGHYSVRLTGPDVGAWAISGVWQPLDSAPGEQWAVTARVGHRSAEPIVGSARGIINVEWRDASDDLISYESHDVLLASSATDVMHRVSFVSGPAPAGTVRTRILMAKLQSPAQESGAVLFDHVTFRSDTPPTFEDIQWNDFPGGRTVDFAQRTWRVKGPGLYGPGPNLFSDDPGHVWVDTNGWLHMTIRKIAKEWYSTEVTVVEPLGYGDYIYTTRGAMDHWAANVVLGLFTWQYPQCWNPGTPWNLQGEFDVEISRWGVPGDDLGQFVAQPYDYPGNIERFPIAFTTGNQRTSFGIRILPDRIEARSWLGGPEDEQPATLIHTWTYTGPHIPLPEQPRVHINFWQFGGPPGNNVDHEAVIDDFRFVPACDDDPDGNDFRCMVACVAGPGADVLTSCQSFDRDDDGDVDLSDFADYQFAAP